MKKLMVLVITMILLTTNAMTVMASSDSELLTSYERSVVRVVAIYSELPNKDGVMTPFISNGTGFFIDKNTVVTNAHVIANVKNRILNEIIVMMHTNGTTIKSVSTWSQSSKEHDLAIVNIDDINMTSLVVPLSIDESTSIGDKVMVVGFPVIDNKMFYKLTRGEITDNTTEDKDSTIILSTNEVHHGSSGSPLINESGKVSGIVYRDSAIASYSNGIFTEKPSTSKSISAGNLLDVVESLTNKYKIRLTILKTFQDQGGTVLNISFK